jgi:hypothetical protein
MPALDRALYAKMSAFGAAADCVVYRGRKYMRELDPASAETRDRAVFDLAADPRETTPLPEEFGSIDPILTEEASDHGLRYPARLEAPSKELEAQLHALGYLDEANQAH